MAVHFPRSKVAIFNVGPEGEARFASSGGLAWSMTSDRPGADMFDVGEEVEVTIGRCVFAAQFVGTFAKEGEECPVVSAGEPPLAYYVLGAWCDAGDEDFPPVLAVRPEGRVLGGVRLPQFVAFFLPGMYSAFQTGRRGVE